MQFGAVIAAAGLSSRMNAFKPLLPLGETTFIERIVTTFLEGGVEKIAVITGWDASLLESALSAYKIKFIYNENFLHTDMFYSASLGLRFMADKADIIFFTPVDAPLFNAATVRLLAEHLLQSGDHIAVPAYQGKGGHPLAMLSCAAQKIILEKNDGGLKGAVKTYAGPKAKLETHDKGILLNANTPEDYRAIFEYNRMVKR